MSDYIYTIFIVVLIFSYYRGIVANLKILFSFKILNKIYSKYLASSKILDEKRIFILIPLLREQDLVPQLLKVFSSLKGEYKVIFITTERETYEYKVKLKAFISKIIPKLTNAKNFNSFKEYSPGYFSNNSAKNIYYKTKNLPNIQKKDIYIKSYNNIKTTKKVLEKALNLQNNKEIFEILHYPKSKGIMSNQLNFACLKLKERYPKSELFISVFNADSVVDKDYINLASSLSSQESIIQQSAIFLNNFKNPSNTWHDAFLKGNGLLQTRWTFAHEIPQLYTQRKENKFSFLEVAHVVGHGLLISNRALEKVKYFPTQFTNEDLPLGYLLRLQGYNFQILPKLESADTPSSISSVFKQYRTWFYGAFHSPLYFKFFIKNSKSNFKNLILGFYWSLQSFYRSMIWLSISFTWLFLFIFPIASKQYELLLCSILSFINYSIFSWIITVFLINKNKNLISGYKPIRLNLLDILMTLPVYLTHSLGPVLAILDSIKSIITKKEINKLKTER
ncbi:glycosyltransferase family 2 protein [Candidatus Dojkabacteria bacterium]|jgi:hypothetical protein|nr:glycosyltransferase family 2 protein [Candidatus Dojkabacteria bacterium]